MRRFSAFFAAAVLSAAALPAAAQDLPINQDAIGAGGRQQISAYIGEQVKRLAEGTPEEIAAARAALIDPVRRANATAQFKQIYSADLLRALRPVWGGERVISRLNAAVVLPHLTVSALFEPGVGGQAEIATPLADDAAGVRYWAAHAASRSISSAQSGGMNEAFQKRVLDVLKPRITDEPSPWVRRPLNEAVGGLRDLEAAQVLLMDGLAAALPNMVADPSADMGAAAAALERLVGSAPNIKNWANGKAELERLTALAYQYTLLAATQLAAAGPAADAGWAAHRKTVIDAADGLFPYMHRYVNAPDTPPSSFDTDLRNNNWNKVLLRLEGEWEPILTGPVGIESAKLRLPEPKAAEESATEPAAADAG